MNRMFKGAGLTVLIAAAAGAVAALVVRDQMDRHQRDLFSPYPLRRLACLGYMAREEATVDNINLLRDFVAWEPRRLLRNRARVILQRMEDQASEVGAETRSMPR
jgi:hypothetical protein